MTSPATPLANMFGWGVKVPILRALESVILASEDLRSGMMGADAAGTGKSQGDWDAIRLLGRGGEVLAQLWPVGDRWYLLKPKTIPLR